MCIKANLSYYSNFNYNKGNNKKQKKNPSVNLTTDNSNSRNLKSSPCNYFINSSPPIESIELKMNNDLKNLKNLEKTEKFNKLKKIYEESDENFIPKEFRKIF